MTDQRQPGIQAHSHKTLDSKPQGRAVLLGSLILLPSAQALLSNSLSLSVPVSSDSSFPSVRQAHSALEGISLPAALGLVDLRPSSMLSSLCLSPFVNMHVPLA